MFRYFLPTFYGSIAILLVGLVPCPVMGQVVTKKHLTPADYGLWHTMGAEQLSENGGWVSYRFSYDGGVDTTFVTNTKSLQKYVFPRLRLGTFVGEKRFAYLTGKDLGVFDLEHGKEKRYSDVSRFEFSGDGQYLVTLEQDSTLVVRKNEEVLERMHHVSTYAWNSDKNQLVYATAENGISSVGSLRFKKGFSEQLILKPTAQTFDVLKWQGNGNSVAFYGVANGTEAVYFYDFVGSALFTLKSSDANFPRHRKVAPNLNIELKVSRDGTKVFFGMTHVVAKDTTQYSDALEVWHAKDQLLYRERKLQATVAHPQYLAVWFLHDGIVRQITSDDQKWVALTGNQEYAVLGDVKQYEPRYQLYPNMDYNLLHLKSGVKKLVLEKQSGYDSQMDFSPDGRYISYYKNGDWWLYDILQNTHTNKTKDLNVIWDNSYEDAGNELRVYGQAGWTLDGKGIIYYDKNDIWLLSVTGSSRKKLTRGKENGLQFRIAGSSRSGTVEFNYSDSGTSVYDFSKELILTSYNFETGAKGLFTLLGNSKEQSLVVADASITKYVPSKDASAFICVKQRFDLSPEVLFFRNARQKVVAKSNSQERNYHWGKSEMLSYSNSLGAPLHAILIYPSNYDATKKYPMVVFIYEVLSSLRHQYVNPTLYNGIGFNVSTLSLDGYFVLLPDISYEKGDSGISATDCVVAATKKVLALGIINPKQIGLTGQSFGGYETNFILTQTNLFAAAVSGSAVSDTVQHYFTINKDYNTIDGWRYENQQYRMGCSFYDNQEAYYRNSPLLNASKINTPLLTWAGKLDENVNSRQAEGLYAALRRLEKEHVMLVYNTEGHIFSSPENQSDLTLKINDWFGHYLKGAPKANWMQTDLERK